MSVAVGSGTRTTRVRAVLKAGAAVFTASALALLAFPGTFVAWLGLDSTPALSWSMRMIGITLVALTGNMWSHATRGTDASVLFTGKVMLVAAGALGAVTLVIPVNLGFFSIAYACVGFGFSAAYVWALASKSR